jgi:broad specificity phosphatase PhoE
MTTHLIFIRHARSTWNDAGRWQGQADPPLSETGQSEARVLADRLAGWTINAIYASDLIRARSTATVVGERLGLQPVIDPIWRERGIGAFEGLTSEEIKAQFPEAWVNLHKGPMVGVPGAETIESVLDRSRTGCRTLIEQHQNQAVAVISHGGMILATLVHLLELVPEGFGRLVGGGHTAISQVAIIDGHARLMRLNDSAHLELMNGRAL